MKDITPSLLQQTFFKNNFAKDFYQKYLLFSELEKDYPSPVSMGKLKNILHINTAYGKGGAAKICGLLNNGLDAYGLSSNALVDTDYLANKNNVYEIKQTNPDLHKTLHKASRNLGWLDFFNPASFDIPDYKLFKDADVVHLHNIHGAYFSLFLLPQLSSLKPTVWTLHDEQAFTGHCSFTFDCEKWIDGCGDCSNLDYYPKLKTDTTEFLVRTKQQIYNKSHLTFAVPSQWLKNRTGKSILGGHDIRVIHNGIDEKVFVPTDKIEAKKLLGLPLDKKILLFTASGSIKNPQKGGEYLLQAYETLKGENDILFLNLGGDDKTKKANWLDIPYVTEEHIMALYYSAADLFVYPSMAESFGLVIGEAMACGTTVIAFNNTAIPEILKHMETGYLAENKNMEDFVQGIKLFLSDESLRKNAEQRSREVVQDNFTMDTMIKNYIKLYEEIVEKCNV